MNDFVIAKYIRLSVDDGITESLSIPHQHLLLDNHIEELEMAGALVSANGGATSTNLTIIDFVDNG